MDKERGIQPVQPVFPTLRTQLDLKNESEKRRQALYNGPSFQAMLKKEAERMQTPAQQEGPQESIPVFDTYTPSEPLQEIGYTKSLRRTFGQKK